MILDQMQTLVFAPEPLLSGENVTPISYALCHLNLKLSTKCPKIKARLLSQGQSLYNYYIDQDDENSCL